MKTNIYTGKNFEWEIRKSLHTAGWWWFRIQDTNDVSRFVKQAIAEKQPGDFFAVSDGVPILIECKTSRNKTSFPLFYHKSASIPLHQITYGQKLIKSGGMSWILIRKDEPRNKRVFAFSPNQIKSFYDGIGTASGQSGSKQKSVKWSVIEERGLELERLSTPVRYDLSILLNSRWRLTSK